MRRKKRSKSFQVIQFVLIILAGLCGVVTGSDVETIPIKLFDMGQGCQVKDEGLKEIVIYQWLKSYIAPPREDQERDVWLKAMKDYRQAVRSGTSSGDRLIDMNFDGVRAWVRLNKQLSKELALKPQEIIKVSIETRWLAGNDEICFAFDRHNPSDAVIGWTGVQATGSVAKDGKWHRIEAEVKVPDFDIAKQWLRPIIGMDGTRNATPGHIEIRSINIETADKNRMAKITESISTKVDKPLDRSLYDEPSQQWMKGAYTCHFTFMYDKSFYDAVSGEYKIDSFLRDGQKEFGGYDIILLWHAYPRIGVDHRNQLDFYRDMPGGLEGIRGLVESCHEKGVRVFINYNPWDTGTSREGKSDEDFLVELVGQTNVDGIFLDTMFGDSPVLREKLEAVRPGISLCPERSPPIKALSLCNGSWAQGSVEKIEYVPSLDHRKWIEPRHMRWQIWRWMPNHRQEIRRTFFNGSGMLVWENIFGTYNPWLRENRRMWRRAAAILRYFESNFASDAWDPYYPVSKELKGKKYKTWAGKDVPGLFISRWPGDKGTVFTLFLKDRPKLEYTSGRIWYNHIGWPLFEVPYNPDMVYYDLWNGAEINPERFGDKTRISGFIDRFSGISCVLEIDKTKVDKPLLNLIAKQRKEAQTPGRFLVEKRNFEKSVIEPEPVNPTRKVSRNNPPDGMVFVPGGKRRIYIEHRRRECACYPDPQTPADQWEKFLWGALHDKNIVHDFDVELEGFFIDEAEVTNSEYKKFLKETGYKPRFAKNFLKHWPNSKMPDELAERPVVYVDIDDARAYAKWAGKRLPTEYEWHLAAQGTDGRKWPWGNKFDESKCNTTGDRTMPVRSLPEGRSPYGCYHMSGNVYEWTESCRDDGHTRFVIIRGGSYFKAEGSHWYVPGGPQPCDSHTKFIQMWSGLDRCATIGFRCVVDAK